MKTIRELMQRARQTSTVIPGFTIPYLPMMEPTVHALRDARCFGLIMVARLEWVKFEAGSPRAIRDEYQRVKDERFTRLHLDHVPVIDEDQKLVNYEACLVEAIELGYQSVMVDGSRLDLDDNIAATAKIVNHGHAAGIPVEGELGAVLGHEDGPLPPYEQLFASGEGFTDPDQAKRFVAETKVDWLSVSIGNIHGAISKSGKDKKKVQAKLNIEHLDKIHQATDVPLVLHGGTGIRKEDILEAIRHGLTKINIGTATRQPYETAIGESVEKAQQAVYNAVVCLVRDELEIEGSAKIINPNR